MSLNIEKNMFKNTHIMHFIYLLFKMAMLLLLLGFCDVLLLLYVTRCGIVESMPF